MTGPVTVRRATTSTRVAGGLLALGVVALAMLPYVIVPSQVFGFIDLLVFMLLATMWNLLAGYGGMVSVGQQAYIGLGAYGLVYLADVLGVDAFTAVPLVTVLTAAFAVPVSFLVFRLVGGYFAIGTWVIAEVARLLTVQVDDLGAGSGTSLRGLGDIDRDLRIAYTYWFALGVTTLAVVATYLLVRSRLGIALTAIRDEPTAAASNGVEVTRVKRIVFVVSAAGCGAAGAILALASLRVQPDSVYSVQWTAFMIFMVVIGGVGTLEGPLVGAVLFFLLREWLAQLGVVYLVVLGAVAIVVTLFVPQGLWGVVSRGRFRLFAVGHSVRVPADASPAPAERGES